MKKRILFCVLFLSLITAWLPTGFANEAQMNQSIVLLINQIDAMMPVLDQAKAQQPKGARIQFHFDSFVGADGKEQPGLRQDLLTIRRALVAQLNQPKVQPATVKPIAGDFVSGPHE